MIDVFLHQENDWKKEIEDLKEVEKLKEKKSELEQKLLEAEDRETLNRRKQIEIYSQV